MSQLKTILNLDPNFQVWDSATAIATANWTFAATNATQLQLSRRHPPGHIERTRFPSDTKAYDYTYQGEFSWRGVISVAGGTFALTSNEFAFDAGMVPAVSLVYRAVAGLTLTARVVIAPSIAGTDMGSLQTSQAGPLNNQRPRKFFWDTTTTRDLSLMADGTAVDFWRRTGIQGPEAPGGCGSLTVRIDVTDISATIPAYFDVGELAVTAQGSRVHGVG